MFAFDKLRASLTYASWSSPELHDEVKKLVTSIENDADEVGFETGPKTQEIATSVESIMNDLDSDVETKPEVSNGSSAEEENDPLAGFGEE